MDKEKNILVLYKNNGKFYNAVGIDAYILNYLFNYKVLKNDRCGFPDNAIDNVKSILNKYMISYQIVYSDCNPLLVDFKGKNKYKEYAVIAKNNSIINNRINNIINKIENLDQNELEKILLKIEDILN